MKPKFGREIALLMLPVLLIGGVAIWSIKAKSWSGFGAPRGLYEGKPRLEITDWKSETPSALDFARGISSRWTVRTWHGGACSPNEARYRDARIVDPTNLYFAWKRAGKWHRTSFRSGQSEVEARFFRQRSQPANYETQLGLPLDLVPRDAEEVRLRGHLMGFIDCEINSRRTPSPPIDLILKAPGQAWPTFAGSRVSGLKFTKATQQWCFPNPIKDPKGDKLQVESEFLAADNKNFNFEPLRSRVTDAGGKTVLEIRPIEWRSEPRGRRSVSWILDTRQLKGHKAPFALRFWATVDDKQWPLSVVLPLDLARSARVSEGISTYNSKPIQPIR